MKTYTKTYIMLVFVVKYRLGLISDNFKEHLYALIGKMIKEYGLGSKPIRIGGYKDHLHLFISLSPNISISDLVRELKSRSTKWINDNKLVVGKFAWQPGYAAFSYSESSKHNVIQYIDNQEEHHKRHTFREELERLYKIFEIEYDNRDMPDDPE